MGAPWRSAVTIGGTAPAVRRARDTSDMLMTVLATSRQQGATTARARAPRLCGAGAGMSRIWSVLKPHLRSTANHAVRPELKSSDHGSGCRQLVLYHSACPWQRPSAIPLRVPDGEDQSAVRSKAPPHQRQQHVGIHEADSTEDRIGAIEPPVSRGKEFFSRATREGQPGFQLRELRPRLDDVVDRHIDSVHDSPTTREGRSVGADPTTKLQHPLICENPENLRCRATSGKLAPLEPVRVAESQILANTCAGTIQSCLSLRRLSWKALMSVP